MYASLFEEAIFAGRGIGQLLLGRANAADNFDLSLRGLTGSFIAFLVAAAVNAFLPILLGAGNGPGAAAAIFMVAIIYGVQAGFAALVLRQFGRFDGFIPYLVCDNWATFFITLLSAVLVVLQLDGDVALIVLGIAILIIEINIARIIVTLRPMQIAGFLIVQVIGVLVGLMILGALLPPDLVTQASGAVEGPASS